MTSYIKSMDLYLNVPERIFDILPKYEKEFGSDKDMLAGKEDGKWKHYTVAEVRSIVDKISHYLLHAGIGKGDKIAISSRNCPEWSFIDWAIQQIGGICVPLYPTISDEDYKFDLTHSEAKLFFIYGSDIHRRIVPIIPELTQVREIISIKPVEGLKSLDDIMKIGAENADSALLETARAAVKPEDLATIIYTSGTTGTPKGVMLTHKNMISNMMCLDALFPASRNTVMFSFLPLSHIYEREVVLAYLNMGAVVYYSGNMGTIVDDICEVKPTVFTTIPRLIEKIHSRILLNGEKLKGISKAVFFWAMRLGYHYDECGHNNIFYRLRRSIADKLVYRKIRENLGNNIEVIILGGAAIQPKLAKLFAAMKMPVMEGYGLTETSPVVAVNSPVTKKIKFGTVGMPVQNVQVKISGDDEILVKGPSVMAGYFKDPELTASVIDGEGFFHTGDRGFIDKDGFLRLTGRMKEIFKTSMGKFISPSIIENKLLESPYISSILVIGDNRKFAAALIVPDFERLRLWCKENKIAYTNDAEMVLSRDIINFMRVEIDKYNKTLGDYERIMKFKLLPAEWSLEKGEITSTMKVKRDVVKAHYKDLIDQIYEE